MKIFSIKTPVLHGVVLLQPLPRPRGAERVGEKGRLEARRLEEGFRLRALPVRAALGFEAVYCSESAVHDKVGDTGHLSTFGEVKAGKAEKKRCRWM